jgi:hypothetical protein
VRGKLPARTCGWSRFSDHSVPILRPLGPDSQNRFKAPDLNGDDEISAAEFGEYIRDYMQAYPNIPEEDYPTFGDFDSHAPALSKETLSKRFLSPLSFVKTASSALGSPAQVVGRARHVCGVARLPNSPKSARGAFTRLRLVALLSKLCQRGHCERGPCQRERCHGDAVQRDTRFSIKGTSSMGSRRWVLVKGVRVENLVEWDLVEWDLVTEAVVEGPERGPFSARLRKDLGTLVTGTSSLGSWHGDFGMMTLARMPCLGTSSNGTLTTFDGTVSGAL